MRNSKDQMIPVGIENELFLFCDPSFSGNKPAGRTAAVVAGTVMKFLVGAVRAEGNRHSFFLCMTVHDIHKDFALLIAELFRIQLAIPDQVG